jgi:hypothetical protein
VLQNRKHRRTLPYDGITRTGSKGMSHSATQRPPREKARYWKAGCCASRKL